jgi:YggT family protein
MSALAEISDYLLQLLQTALNLFLLAVILRFLLQTVRADFYNPISQFLVRITNPLLKPMRGIIPGFGGLDTAALTLALAIQILAIVLALLFKGQALPNIFLLVVWGVLGIVGMVVKFYFFALLATIILSWVAAGSQNPAVALLHRFTEPVMAPFRRILPPMGGLDLSPILVFVTINILQILLLNAASSVGLAPEFVFGL